MTLVVHIGAHRDGAETTAFVVHPSVEPEDREALLRRVAKAATAEAKKLKAASP